MHTNPDLAPPYPNLLLCTNPERNLEANLLRHLAQIIVTFLKTEGASQPMLTGRQFLPQKNIANRFEAPLVYRQGLTEQLELHWRRLREVEILPGYQIVIKSNGSWRVVLWQRLPVNVPSGRDVKVDNEANSLAAERTSFGERDANLDVPRINHNSGPGIRCVATRSAPGSIGSSSLGGE